MSAKTVVVVTTDSRPRFVAPESPGPPQPATPINSVRSVMTMVQPSVLRLSLDIGCEMRTANSFRPLGPMEGGAAVRAGAEELEPVGFDLESGGRLDLTDDRLQAQLAYFDGPTTARANEV